MEISNIIEGWRNHLFPPEKLKDFIGETSVSRLEICIGCEHNSTPNKIKMFSKCRKCGCPLIQKSKSLQSKCPIDKWGPVATPEQEHEIKSAINGEEDSNKNTLSKAPDSN